ncbi:MAG: hypothetical protein AAB667_01375 [Patescibacteria group bacterium]
MLIGFEKQKKYFENAIANGAVAHAYIFFGPESIGKRMFAQEIYKKLNNREKEEADGDLRVISPRTTKDGDPSTIPVEDIRDLPYFLSLSSLPGTHKVVIIDNADRLTLGAANALLKTLEEPLPHRVFFLITSQPEMISLTIRSRCQEIRFAPHDDNVITAQAKSAGLSNEDAEFIAMIARGRIGMVADLISSKSVSVLKKDLKDFQQAAGKGIFQRFVFAKNVADSGRAGKLVDLWLSWARTRVVATDKAPGVLHALIKLSYELSQSQYNQRLALERFFLVI